MVKLVADGRANDNLYMLTEGERADVLDDVPGFGLAPFIDWQLVEIRPESDRDGFTILSFADNGSARAHNDPSGMASGVPAGPIVSRIAGSLLRLALWLIRLNTRQRSRRSARPGRPSGARRSAPP
jgi:hypothetical protein